MNSAIRWRIISLQAMLVVILASASGFLFYEGNFVTGMVHDELVAQQIFFPGTDTIKAGGALDPAKFSAEIRNYAGQQVDNGDAARVSSALSAVNAQIATTPKTDPNYATLQAQATTLNGQKTSLFQGEMLRGTLLNSWGWWMVGNYTVYAAIGLMIAAIGVLGAVAFELLVAVRKPESFKVKVGQKVLA